MAREKSWFAGFTKKPAETTTTAITTMPGRDAGRAVELLANQVSTGANLGGIDPEKEREPPARPLAIVFPDVKTTALARWSDDHPPPDFQGLYGRLIGNEGVLSEHLKAVNCDRRGPCKGDELVPRRPDGKSFLPFVLDPVIGDKIAELKITNDEAFRALSKTTRPGDVAPRLTHTRKFWIALENMAQYFDTTDEQYLTINNSEQPTSPGESIITRKLERYKGRRTSNGNDMPDVYRAETVRAFVESVTSSFNCRVTSAYVAGGRLTPVLEIGNIELPVRMTGVVMRLPTDRDRARSGITEGPILGILERNTIDFGSSLSPKLSWRKCEHDILREIAALLYMAQQRRREGKTAVTPCEGKWYTKPRWGGGAGSDLPSLTRAEEDEARISARISAHIANAEPVAEKLKANQRTARKNLKTAQNAAKRWKDLTCKPGLWDSKTDYKAIGRQPGSPNDEVSITTDQTSKVDEKLTHLRSS